MRDLIHRIFGTKKPAPECLLFAEMPAWLTGLEEAAAAGLAEGIRGPMADIRNAEARLRLLTTTLAGAEQDPVMHPKLKTIAKNSLPQFVRAMNSTTARELPDDPEEFYAAAAECVKNCIQNTRGPGRYLQAIFPDEMKAIRMGIDEMGRGINTINPLLAAYRQRMAEVKAARAILDEIGTLRTDYTRSEERRQRMQVRCGEITGRCTAIDTELAGLPADPAMPEVEGLKKELAVLEGRRDEALRTYSALSMTASHVFRKAEKLASRDRHAPGGATLRAAMETLSDHNIPAPDPLGAALNAAWPVTLPLIEAGQISLKNKEERSMFADTVRFTNEICDAAATFRSLEQHCRQAESLLAGHRITMLMQSLAREKVQLQVMLERENQTLSDLTEWREKTLEHIPALYADLRARVDALSGNTRILEEYRNQPLPGPGASDGSRAG